MCIYDTEQEYIFASDYVNHGRQSLEKKFLCLERRAMSEVREGDDDSDLLARAVHAQYNLLPSRGKPRPNEWTVLAGIVARSKGELTVVSLATGNRCLGVRQLCRQGTVVNDSHAEILARRAFKKFCACEMQRVALGDGPVSPFFVVSSAGSFRVRDGVSFHLYISASPCGDASVFGKGAACGVIPTGAKEVGRGGKVGGGTPSAAPSDQPRGDGGGSGERDGSDGSGDGDGGGGSVGGWNGGGSVLGAKRRQARAGERGAGASRDGNMRRGLGASGSAAAASFSASAQHSSALGVLRTKSGRSDLPPSQLTRSMSCSDKIASWHALGLQGSLLSPFFESSRRPVPLTSVVVSSDSEGSVA